MKKQGMWKHWKKWMRESKRCKLNLTIVNEDKEEFEVQVSSLEIIAVEELLKPLLDKIAHTIYTTNMRYKNNIWQKKAKDEVTKLFQEEMIKRGLVKDFSIRQITHMNEPIGISICIIVSNRSLTSRFGVTEPSAVELIHHLKEETNSTLQMLFQTA